MLSGNRKILKTLGLGPITGMIIFLSLTCLISIITDKPHQITIPLLMALTYLATGSLWVIKGDLIKLSNIIESIEKIDQKDLTLQAESLAIKGNNTLFHLATNKRRMSEGFQDTISEIGYSSKELSTTSNTLAHNTFQQSKAITSIATAINKISSSIEDMTEKMKSTNESAKQSYEQGEKGKQTIDEVREHMIQVASCAQQTHEHLSNLEVKTSFVSSISNVVGEIADQTNLLALNAAIEAARAGEHGRGFSVVADEVRSLANRSSESAKEISSTVDEMKKQMNAVKTSMDSVINRTKLTLDGADGAQITLIEITNLSQKVSSMVLAMTEATDQQNQATHNISKRVKEVAIAASENSEVAQQSSEIAAHLYDLCQLKGAKHV
jgi:methyl-accepting chemotaxis protein